MAYTNTKVIDAIIVGADKHREADDFIKGTYAKFEEYGFRGCAIGCAIHDAKQAGHLPESLEDGDHAGLSAATGIPETLLRLEDSIYEGLATNTSWPGRFARAARHRDLTMAWPRFALWLLSDETSPMWKSAQDSIVKQTIDGVVSLYNEWIDTGEIPSEDKWVAARDSTDAVADVADADAAWAAASAAARAAARNAGVAAGIAARNASAATRVAAGVARVAAWVTMSDKLIEIMETCPEGGES